MTFWVAGTVALVGTAVKIHQNNVAASAQRYATEKADNGLTTEAQQARDDYAPYRATGETATNALNGLMKDPSSITSQPSYGFELGQGQQAIDRSAAGAGGLYSGATLKALDRYGQNYAGTKLNETTNRLQGAAQLGLNAVNGTTQSGQNAQNQISNNLLGAGNVTAAADVANGTAISNELNQVAGGYMSMGTGTGSQAGTTTGSNQSSYNLNSGNTGFGWKGSGGF